EQLRIGRELYQEDVADAPTWNAQAAFFVEERVHERIGVNVPLHDRVGLSCTHEFDGLCRCGCVAIRRDDPVLFQFPVERLTDGRDRVWGADETRFDEPERTRFAERFDHHFLRGIHHRDAEGLKRFGLTDEMLQLLRINSHSHNPCAEGCTARTCWTCRAIIISSSVANASIATRLASADMSRAPLALRSSSSPMPRCSKPAQTFARTAGALAPIPLFFLMIRLPPRVV